MEQLEFTVEFTELESQEGWVRRNDDLILRLHRDRSGEGSLPDAIVVSAKQYAVHKLGNERPRIFIQWPIDRAGTTQVVILEEDE